MSLVGADRLREVTSFDESKAGVKGLFDAGVTTIPGIFVHPPEALSSPEPPASLSIPVIDLAGINSPGGRAEIVDRVRSAAATWGFFQVVNHGAPEAALDGIMGAVKAFHEQAPEAKRVHYTLRDERRKGFSYCSNFGLYRSARSATWQDYIQAWMSPDPPEERSVPEVCRREMFEWDARAAEVGGAVMELLGEGLGMGPRRFRELTCLDGRVFVGVYYPYCPQPDLTVGLRSHTDTVVLTVLRQNHVSGLQVKHGDYWVDVKPVPGGLIVNVGDLLQIMSNDVYKSVEHRVRANASPEPRISAVTFFSVLETVEEMGPLPELVSPENPPKFRNFTMSEYYDAYFTKELGSKTLIETFKIEK